MEIPGTDRTIFEITMQEDFFKQREMFSASLAEEELEILDKKRCDRGTLYTCSAALTEEDIEIIVEHFRFLLKHNIL